LLIQQLQKTGVKQGVVAFGIYVYGDRPYSLFRDWYGYAHVLDVSLVEVTVVDNKKRRIETLPFLKTEFLKATKDSSMDFYISNYLRVTVNPIHTNEEFNIRNNLPDPINPIHAFILPDSKKEYTLESVSFQINVDKSRTQKCRIEIPSRLYRRAKRRRLEDQSRRAISRSRV
jgi:hypothetical protein